MRINWLIRLREFKSVKSHVLPIQMCFGWAFLCLVILLNVVGCSPSKQEALESKYKQGVGFYREGNFEKAMEVFKQVINDNPNHPFAHNDLGACHAAIGKKHEAVIAYKQSVKVNPGYYGVHLNMGVAFFEQSRWQEAVDAFKQAIKLKPDTVDAHYNLGLAYLELNKNDLAFEVLKGLKDLDPAKAEELTKTINEYEKLAKNKSTNSDAATQTVTFYKRWAKIKKKGIIAKTKDDYLNAISIYESGDTEALVRMAMSGEIRIVLEEQDAFVEDLHFWHDLAEVRIKGDPQIYWTSTMMLQAVNNNEKKSISDSEDDIPAIITDCKIDGIATDDQGSYIYVINGKSVDSIREGGAICDVEIIKIYSPGEQDGITKSSDASIYSSRVKVKAADGEEILMNGDYLKGEPSSEPIKAIVNQNKAEVQPINIRSNPGRDFFRKLSDEVFKMYEKALELDANFDDVNALNAYQEILPKAKKAFEMLDLEDKKKLRAIIERCERRESEIKKYLEAVLTVKNQFNTPESLSKWLKRNIHYESDRYGDDYWQPPHETLAKKVGDCEDYAILAQALLSEIGISSQIIMVVYGKGYKEKAHALCVFKRNGAYEYLSGSYLHKSGVFSFEGIMDKDFPEWKAIVELNFKNKSRVDLARR